MNENILLLVSFLKLDLWFCLLHQFTFAQNRPKSVISGVLGLINYITLKVFAMTVGDGAKCKLVFGVQE